MNAGERLRLSATRRRLGYDLADGGKESDASHLATATVDTSSSPIRGDFLANIRKLIFVRFAFGSLNYRNPPNCSSSR